MYFITAQAFPTQIDPQKGMFNIASHNYRFLRNIPFPVLWAVPVTTFAETMASMLCTAPNIPMLFAVVKSDDYVRVDKVEHYRRVMNNEYPEADAPLADDDLPPHRCEYALNRETMSKAPIFGGMVAGVTHLDSDDDLKMAMMAMQPVSPVPGLVDLVNRCVDDLPRWKVSAEQLPATRLDDTDTMIKIIESWLAYRYSVMPLIVSAFAEDTRNPDGSVRIHSDYLESCRVNATRLMNASNKFALWSYGDCSVEGFETAYDDVKSLIIDDPDMLHLLAERVQVGRNVECPCGSGRKTKKCHPVLC